MKKPVVIALTIGAALIVAAAVAYIVWIRRRSDGDPDTSVIDFVKDVTRLSDEGKDESQTNTNTMQTQNNFGDMSLPRGYRNNNPGNIRISSTAWKGKVPKEKNTDGAFEQFNTMAYGFRALLVCLNTYMTKYGLTTIRKMINRWAPAGDGNNNPTGYANFVSQKTGVGIDEVVDRTDRETMCKIAHAIAWKENGYEPRNGYTDIYAGWAMK